MFEEESLQKMIKMLKKNGTLVVKSRKKQITGVIASDLVNKELKLNCVNYYSFNKSMKWLEKNNNKIKHLLGSSYDIKQWEKAFEEANSAESKKIFIKFER
jgi:threonine dehydrogenase-like Zn-dependent dehydrogenase